MNYTHAILYRPANTRDEDLAELEAVNAEFANVCTQRHQIDSGRVVIGRYSVLPYYAELEADVWAKGSKMLVPKRQHDFIADLLGWYSVLGAEFTPRTWDAPHKIPYGTPVVLKGATNSRKDRWDTMMYAESKPQALEVYLKLQDDGLIGQQTIYAREFVKLQNLGTGLNGMPISREYRCFCINGTVFASGFYWSNHADRIPPEVLLTPPKVIDFVEHIILPMLRDHANFVTVDVGIGADGKLWVIELNDPQMCGLCGISPNQFYGALAANL